MGIIGIVCDVCQAKGVRTLLDPESETGKRKYFIPKKIIEKDGKKIVTDFHLLDLCDQCVIDILAYGSLYAGVQIEGLKLLTKEEIKKHEAEAEKRKDEDTKPVPEVSEE